MEMIDRYVYAVTQRLPQSQRQDIAQELRSLIEDMLEEKTGEKQYGQEEVEQVLLELGNPAKLADQYREPKRYLIGPQLFHPYISIMKIVLTVAAVAMGVVFILETILDPAAILQHFLDLLISVIIAATQMFAWITIGFAIAQYYGVGRYNWKTAGFGDEWKPSELPQIPDTKKQIKRSEAVFGIIFSVIALVAVRFSNHLFGVTIFENGEWVAVIPFLDTEAVAEIMPIIYLVVAFGILKEAVKLIIGKWSKKMAVYNLIVNGVILGLAWLVLKDQLIWNPHFMQELAQFSEFNSEEFATVQNIWKQSQVWIVIIFILTILIDTGIGFYKAFRK
ncbi:HAAS signaling domain-containing protein [Sediminibacillus albus]|uniref:Uncharacterized protein n=1 Tax=Sediminibacillus albus TaxID=407036 RepID=A0A1G8WR53_9BACI|nr:hypothetical protein [Sediminibacillus albus]SDJ80080.1 hypothetical protein SAMN05216243_0918 [Sediminibacillus albus]